MEIYAKNGQLSAYGYACGYITSFTEGEKRKELYREGGNYHVRYTDGTPVPNASHKFKIWKSVETLKEAHKIYHDIKF